MVLSFLLVEYSTVYNFDDKFWNEILDCLLSEIIIIVNVIQILINSNTYGSL